MSSRWNSTDTNIESVLVMKPPLQLLASNDQWASKIPTAPEWNLLEALHRVLALPKQVSLAWEGEKEPTINLVVERIVWLHTELDKLIGGDLGLVPSYLHIF